jgi:hypothetical protein
LRVLNGTYDELENNADRYRHRRHPERAECFTFHRVVAHDVYWHKFTFLVNDTEKPGELIIVDVAHDRYRGWR